MEKVELNVQSASVFVPPLFAAEGMGICSLLALQEGSGSHPFNARYSEFWCLHV